MAQQASRSRPSPGPLRLKSFGSGPASPEGPEGEG
jgi:hypothetical protein